MDIAGKTVVIAGLGVSGRSLAETLRERGARVIGVDERRPDADRSTFEGIDWGRVDQLMVSPVFAPTTPFILQAQAHGVPVMSEVEFAWRLRAERADGGHAAWIGITGTNGKTSTTEMTAAMLAACGMDAPTAGNIASGDMSMSLSRCATDPSHDVLCVELSSFQLHFTDSLELDCAAITNIADDHLDWHGGREGYAADKAKVFHHAKRALVYNADDAQVTAKAMAATTAPGCRRIGFTLGEPKPGQIGVSEGWITDLSGVAGGAEGEAVRLARVAEFTHLTEPDGTVYPHLLADALAALALVLGLGVDQERALEGLRAFAPGGHRIASVAATRPDASGRSIRFVDDSKATNAHAANASLSSFPDGSVVWIAGGLAKGSRFEELVAARRATVKAAVVIGVDQRPMLDAFAACAPDTPLTVIDPEPKDDVMERAVEACGAYAQPGDVVLMAPACASMDQFASYAERGDRFAEAARRWVEGHDRD